MFDALKESYKNLHKSISKVHICGVGFDIIMQDLEIKSSDKKTVGLKTLISGNSEDPIRVQLNDISGIASIGLGHYLANCWAKGEGKNFGLDRYNAVINLSEGNLKENPKHTNKKKIIKSIFQTLEGLTGEEYEGLELNDKFWKETLFIVGGYEGKQFNWINDLTNVIVISEKYDEACKEGFSKFDIGLCPQGMELKSINRLVQKINPSFLIEKEEELRQVFLIKAPHGQSVYDGISDFQISHSEGVDEKGEATGKIGRLKVTEKRVEHKYPLVNSLSRLILAVIKKEITTESIGQTLSVPSEWYAAAITRPSHQEGGAELFSYNIGGYLLVRRSHNNYFSNLGKVDEAINRIKDLTEREIKAAEENDISAEDLLSKIYEKIEKECDFLIESHERVIPRLPKHSTKDNKNDPSYKNLASRLQELDAITLCENIRRVLSNNEIGEDDMQVVFTTVACLFIAEPARCPSTFLPTLMMLDLLESGVINWNDSIYQGHLIDGVEDNHSKLFNKLLFKFSGSFPMCHQNSYVQSCVMSDHTLDERQGLMTLVEYKSSIIMLKWLQLCIDKGVVEEWTTRDFGSKSFENPVLLQTTVVGPFTKRIHDFSMIDSVGIQMKEGSIINDVTVDTKFIHVNYDIGKKISISPKLSFSCISALGHMDVKSIDINAHNVKLHYADSRVFLLSTQEYLRKALELNASKKLDEGGEKKNCQLL